MAIAKTTRTSTKKSRSRRGIAKTYGSYNFIDKDPVIDVMRSLVELEMKVRAIKFDSVLRDIADSSGVSYGCLLGWFYGRTVSPKFSNLQRIAHALGVEFTTAKYEDSPSYRKRFEH